MIKNVPTSTFSSNARVDESQGGNYTCTLSNGAGSDRITYVVDVRASRSNGVVPVPPSPSLASSTSSSLVRACRLSFPLKKLKPRLFPGRHILTVGLLCLRTLFSIDKSLGAGNEERYNGVGVKLSDCQIVPNPFVVIVCSWKNLTKGSYFNLESLSKLQPIISSCRQAPAPPRQWASSAARPTPSTSSPSTTLASPTALRC